MIIWVMKIFFVQKCMGQLIFVEEIQHLLRVSSVLGLVMLE